MKQKFNQSLNELLTEIVIEEAEKEETATDKLNKISALLLNAPYRENPLIGSSSEPEKMVSTIKYFDCVTFVESVIAFLHSESKIVFPDILRKIRYKNSEPSWFNRNHYMSTWLKSNSPQFVSTFDELNTENIERELSTLANYPKIKTIIQYCSVDKLVNSVEQLPAFSLVLFVSTKEDLDYFHVGFLIKKDDNSLILRHAAKNIGKVNDEDFKHFLDRNTMLGITVVKINY